MKTRLAVLLATVGYVGHFPIAPGTAGSAAALPLYVLVRMAGSPALEVTRHPRAAGGRMLGGFGRRGALWPHRSRLRRPRRGGRHAGDAAPRAGLRRRAPLVGFFLFRLFDIVKPFPARQCERLHGGVGIMTDDVVAGIYGNLALRA